MAAKQTILNLVALNKSHWASKVNLQRVLPWACARSPGNDSGCSQSLSDCLSPYIFVKFSLLVWHLPVSLYSFLDHCSVDIYNATTNIAQLIFPHNLSQVNLWPFTELAFETSPWDLFWPSGGLFLVVSFLGSHG